ncbi:MAG: glucosamine inositolphosphorylceramide transferase family protein [Geminicoccaceae bacterium]
MSKLRVGLLVGTEGPKAWHEQIITILAGHEQIDIVVIRASHDLRKRSGSVWRALDRLETLLAHRLFKTSRAEVPLATEGFDALPIETFRDAAETMSSDACPDLLICLDDPKAALQLPRVPKHGLWYLTFDGVVGTGDDVGLSGWYRGRHVVDAALWRMHAPDQEASLIERAHLGVFKPSWSVNRSRHLWRAALLITDNILRLAARDSNFFAKMEKPANLAPSAKLPHLHPLLLGLRCARRLAGHIWQKLVYVEQWQVLATRSTKDMLKPDAYARLEPPPDRFWADPFAVQQGDRDYIFVEELRYETNRGEIAVLEHRDGQLISAKAIIAEPYHMSYPHIVEHAGDLYMVPETRQKRSIDIWKNTSFPDEWTSLGALMENVSAVDTTLFRHDERWWMFTNISRTENLRSADELHAFYTDDSSPVTKAWKPHRQNPLVRDTRFARQGGRVFVDDQGRLIRSAQDSAIRYGYAVLFFHVLDLTPDSFKQTLLHKVEPDWHDDVIGMHSFERRDDLCIFDACFQKKRLRFPI